MTLGPKTWKLAEHVQSDWKYRSWCYRTMKLCCIHTRIKVANFKIYQNAWAHVFSEFWWSLRVTCCTITTSWVTSWQNQQNDMRAQQRLRSAWASAQSDQSLHCALNRQLRAKCFFMRTAKTLDQIRLGRCPGWSESSLGAQVILLVLSCGGSFTDRLTTKNSRNKGLGFCISVFKLSMVSDSRFLSCCVSHNKKFISAISSFQHAKYILFSFVKWQKIQHDTVDSLITNTI